MTTWVLLRGWTREAGHWGGFPGVLAQALGGARVVCVDLPGMGGDRARASPTRIEAMVPACRDALASLALPPPWSLLGLSMGGMVAASWAWQQPGEIQACVLVNSSFGGLSPPWHRLRLGRWLQLPGLAMTWGRPAIEAGILQLTSARPAAHVDVLAEWQALREARPVPARQALRQLRAAARYRAPWVGNRQTTVGIDSAARPSSSPAPVPALVLSSAGDRLVDPACSRAIAQAWPAPLVEHPWAGHDLPLDDGGWIADRVADWMKAGAAGPAAALR